MAAKSDSAQLPPFPSQGGLKWLVTGSSRGLGREIVIAALKAGDTVYATARNPRQLDDLKKDYPGLHTGALDVLDSEAATQSVVDAVKDLGGLDVVVNNAGYANVNSVEDVDIQDYKAQFDTNFYGTVYVTKAAIPYLREHGGGRILQIASVGGRLGTPGLNPYQSAKWAVTGFTVGLAAEVKALGIHCTALQLGGMRTDWAGPSMIKHVVQDCYEPSVGQTASMLEQYHGKQPASPSKIAELCVRLTRHPEPPVELLVGNDAFENGEQAGRARQQSDELWHAVTYASYD